MANEIIPETGDKTAGRKEPETKSRIWSKHPCLTLALLTPLAGIVVVVLWTLAVERDLDDLLELIMLGSLGAGCLVFPWIITAAEIYLAIRGHGHEETYRRGRGFDVAAIPLGVLYSIIYLEVFYSVEFGKNWNEVLYNAETHTPIFTHYAPTIWILALVGYVGYLTLNFYASPKKTPPLIPVLGMAAMYLGTAESILWGIQVYPPDSPQHSFMDIYLLLLPLNCVIITARTVRHKVWEWEQYPHWNQEEHSWLQICNRLLMRSRRWPFAAFMLMWPLLGILIVLLLLAGQRPDAVIKAFTETAQWNLSQQVAPQNIYYDEHYLCTVAAGGHKNIVKPQRLGVRHGHEVIVNRQLCVANAFEQIIEEKTPGFHKVIRHVYDTCGFPVAKLIRSRYTADLIYFLMKPLEWFFLIVLYLVDTTPENRIALQYTGKGLQDFPGAATPVPDPVTITAPAPDADRRTPLPPGPGGCG